MFMVYIPNGFAHGFISLENDTEIIYLTSNYYKSTSEKTLLWNDPYVDIKWPIKPTLISKKDLAGSKLK